MEKLRVLAVLALLLTSGCAGSASQRTASGNEIAITMRDSRFDPTEVSVKRGETVTFRFVNRGSLEHEAFIGSSKEQKAHERAMNDDGDATGHEEHAMDENSSITVKPGRSATLEHRFTDAGTTLIGCHVPGHYEGGMRMTVEVR
jgi:uncharacterized cupredoxin-like copper-binding protein